MNYSDNFYRAWHWADNNKMDNSPVGATALAGYLILEILNELNLKLEQKPHNYKGLMDVCEKFLTKHEHSTNQMVGVTTTFLNVGLDILFETNKKMDKKENDCDALLERVNSWVLENETSGYRSLFKIVTDALNCFNEKVNNSLNIEAKKPVDTKEKLRKKYRSIL